MSNEYKEWLYDKVMDCLFDANVIDKITNITSPYRRHSYLVQGMKDEQPVCFEVWFSDWECEWKFERRELNS